MTSAVYDVSYVGSKVVKPAASLRLSMLQQSLLDLYVSFIPAKVTTSAKAARQLPQRRLTLTDRGIIVSAIDSFPPGRADNDAFYAMPSIVFWDAVRLVQPVASPGFGARGAQVEAPKAPSCLLYTSPSPRD